MKGKKERRKRLEIRAAVRPLGRGGGREFAGMDDSVRRVLGVSDRNSVLTERTSLSFTQLQPLSFPANNQKDQPKFFVWFSFFYFFLINFFKIQRCMLLLPQRRTFSARWTEEDGIGATPASQSRTFSSQNTLILFGLENRLEISLELSRRNL